MDIVVTKTEYPLPLDVLEERIGYRFADRGLLLRAVTHSSYSNENRELDMACNERLEFFGDSILSLIVSEYLFRGNRSMREGELTRLRASLVCENALASYAEKIGLGEFLYLGHGEDRGNGRHRKSIISDAYEALLAAIYIDDETRGGDGKGAVAGFLLPYVKDELSHIGKSTDYFDYKTLLQQVIQQAEGERLEYIVTGESGPDHDKTFVVEARLNSNVIGHGKGRSKRAAEQDAAKEALELFGVDANE